MSEKRRVFILASSTGSGDYYRAWQPYKWFSENSNSLEVSLVATLRPEYVNLADIFVLRDPSMPATFHFAREAKLAGKRIVLDVDQTFEVPPYSPRYANHWASMPYPYLVAGMVDHVIAASPRLAEAMRTNNDQVSVVRSCAPTERTASATRRPDLREEHGIPDDGVVIAWAGHPENAHQLQQVAEVLSWVSCARENVYLLFFGDEHSSMFVPDGRRLTVEFLPFRRYLDFLSLVDIGVCPLDTSLTSQCAPEHPLLEYGSHGIPVIASAVGTMLDVAEEGAPVTLPGSPEEWKVRLLELVDDARLRREQGAALQKYVTQSDTRRIQASELERIYLGEHGVTEGGHGR